MIERQPDHQRGFFLSLDGPDGAGKSTQIRRLATWLEAAGHRVILARDPGGTPLGDRIRSLLFHADDVEIGMRAEMFLFMASRAELVDRVIRHALDTGMIVVCDRYLLANVVYQGYAGGLDVDTLWEIGSFAVDGIFPDLTIVLDLPLDLSLERLGAPQDRLECRPRDFHARVHAGYADACERGSAGGSRHPAPILRIDASADADTIAEKIQVEVRRALARHPRSG
jgi:dTMP kinase